MPRRGGGEGGFTKSSPEEPLPRPRNNGQNYCVVLFLSTYAGHPEGATSLLTSTTLLGLSRWRKEEREEKRSSSRSLSLCLSLSLLLVETGKHHDGNIVLEGDDSQQRAQRQPRCRYRGTDWNRCERRSASYRKHRGASAVDGGEKEGLLVIRKGWATFRKEWLPSIHPRANRSTFHQRSSKWKQRRTERRHHRRRRRRR